MRYLITGGGGFIGSHLADYLLERGDSVHIVDNLSTGRRENFAHLVDHPRFGYTIGDILDHALMDSLVPECDWVVHLAAAVGVKLIMERPVETIVTNVRGTEIVLELAAKHGKRALVASTSEVYGKAMEVPGAGQPLREDDDWTLGSTDKRRWAYACSKAMDEFLSLAYHQEHGVPVVIVRYFNTVGPRQSSRYGMVIPNFVRSALRGEPIRVFGDGEQSRSFTHVSDAVRATVALMDTPAAEGRVFNVGNGAEITMNALAEKVRDLLGSPSPIQHVPYAEVYGPGFEDMRQRTPDIGRIHGLVGFEPRLGIGQILRDVVEHMRAEAAAETAEAEAEARAETEAAAVLAGSAV